MGGILDATSEQTTNRTIQGASGNEAAMAALFRRLAEGSAGQLGDLGALARGEMQGPTAADQALVDKTFGATAEAARGQIDQEMQRMMAQLDEQMAARGIQGSSIEAVNRGQVGATGVNRMAELMAQLQAQQGQSLMNLPFQRAQTQIGANQALFGQIAGYGNPLLSGGLQERLATITTNQKMRSHDPMAALQAGGTMGLTAMGVGGYGA